MESVPAGVQNHRNLILDKANDALWTSVDKLLCAGFDGMRVNLFNGAANRVA
ncbi:hypothetical protein [Paraburkholderia acidipaludis]|uniref:hypothetical protein n=1 Tax=Paraburkholderia acidipaludis TaxID=660537 RepID=UPI0012EC561A|nr:hypothetical protein [Paraburkholderia acidipaludis]